MLLPAEGSAMASLILFDYYGSDPVDKGGLAVCAVLFFITLAVRLGWVFLAVLDD